MGIKFENFAVSTIANAGGIAAGDLSLDVAAGEGALFPTLAAGDYFYATLVDAAANREIVKVTARSVDTFTIVRGQDGTAARAFALADKVELRLNAAAMEEFVTLTDTQTMTNKTLTSPEINEAVAVSATSTQINNKANSEAFVTNANGNPNVSDTQFSIVANISSAWESIGPTGSGADNIWTALDSAPAGADWIEVRIEQLFERTSGTDTGIFADIHARQNGSSEAHSLINKILALKGYGGTTVQVRATCTVTHKIPVSSRMFDLTYWSYGHTLHGAWMTLIGYGYNP